VKLHEAHAALDEPTREQAVVREAAAAGLGTVHVDQALRLGLCPSLRAQPFACGRQVRTGRCACAFRAAEFARLQFVEIAQGIEAEAAHAGLHAAGV